MHVPEVAVADYYLVEGYCFQILFLLINLEHLLVLQSLVVVPKVTSLEFWEKIQLPFFSIDLVLLIR